MNKHADAGHHEQNIFQCGDILNHVLYDEEQVSDDHEDDGTYHQGDGRQEAVDNLNAQKLHLQ